MISLNEIRNRAMVFSHEWEKDSNEDAEAKSFWDGFFDVFGIPRRRVASFEYPVKKQDGAQGFVDVLWKGVLLTEHKSKGRNLDKAYAQAKDYFPGLKDEELPRYIVVSDFEKIRLYDLETNKQDEFLLKDLHKNINLFGFISGYTVREYETEEEASVKAAKLMADFHNELEKTGYNGHELEVFLIRLLFCLFAEDTGIFQKSQFRRYIENRTKDDGGDLGIQLLQIFEVLNTPREKRQTNLDEQINEFPYINGGIFAERLPAVSLDTMARLKLMKCSTFDWSEISASIFGSLFQGVMDENARRSLGAHYTSEKNILKVIQPLFLDELHIEFDQVKYDKKKLETFHQKLANLTFLDPACGCGNFLVVTYRELRRLELKVLERKNKTGQMKLIGTEDLSLLNVNQFYGIEIEEFPALVARTAMYLVDHQMNNELSAKLGTPYIRIPLREPATIINDNALTKNWEEIIPKEKLSYILGNPPFVGARIMSKEQKEAFLNIFENAKGAGNLDFVTAWYEKASHYIVGTNIKVSFVSTNSICQGEQVGILWKRLKEKYGIIIHFAHQTFKWNNDAPGVAAVYCVIVGFACVDTPKKYLYEYETIKSEPKEKEVKHINFYLSEGEDVFLESIRKPICDVPEMIFGNMANDGGNLIIEDEDLEDFLQKEPESKKYIRQLIGSEEFINNKKRWCLWLVNADPSEIRKMPKTLDRIEKTKEHRIKSPREATNKLANTPMLFGEIRQPDTEYLLIPRVSSENRNIIPIGYFPKEVIMTDRCAFVPNANMYLFGILTSSMHMTWMDKVCGRLKSDYNYSINIVYNNFPWPEKVTEENKKKVEECAQNILDVRAKFPQSSLADLYDPNTMPPELVKAHTDLDRAVDACYGKKFETKEQRIEFLFELYKKYVQEKNEK
jgi:hypothetical protein